MSNRISKAGRVPLLKRVPRKPIDIDIDRAIALLRDGATVSEVAPIMNVTPPTLRYRLKKSGVVGRRGDSQERGFHGEYEIQRALKFKGVWVKKMHYACDFDLLVDRGYKVEVKTAGMQMKCGGVPVWKFNIQRHGALREKCDFYIFRLEGVPFSKAAIHLLLSAPLGRKTVLISMRSLITKYSKYAVAYEEFVANAVQGTSGVASVFEAVR